MKDVVKREEQEFNFQLWAVEFTVTLRYSRVCLNQAEISVKGISLEALVNDGNWNGRHGWDSVSVKLNSSCSLESTWDISKKYIEAWVPTQTNQI